MPIVKVKPGTKVVRPPEPPLTESMVKRRGRPPGSGNKTRSNGHAEEASVPLVSVPISGAKLKENIVNVTRRYPGGEDVTETFDARLFMTSTGSVSVSGKTRIGTISQGGEVSVMVTVPCYVEELDNASEFASEKLREYLGREQELLAELAGPDAMAQIETGEELPTDTEGDTDTATEGEGEPQEVEADADYVRSLDSEEALLEFCTQAELEIDMSEYSEDLDAAKEAIIAALWPEGDTEGDGDDNTYTEEELREMSLDDLGEIFKAWDVNKGKLPARAKGASDKDHKTRCIKIILDYQAEQLAEAAQ